MLGQLPWNLSENAPHAAGIAIGELADIITVQLQDATLDQIHLAKIALLDIIGNRLRHTAHQQIFAPQPHRSFVLRIVSASSSSPMAQQNSSKSSGPMSIFRSSEGMTIFATFLLMEISEPVST